jgi:hypothetical protein
MLGFRLRAVGTGQRTRHPGSMLHRPASDNRSQQQGEGSLKLTWPEKKSRSGDMLKVVALLCVAHSINPHYS